ncbi:Stromal cell-derived factor 2-like protein 1 [Fragariocoptes setiger]|uniref:Stromal cell-derived factor 2-like protein 1 n=1 Tax=Fragariocoptes setiger TaxID=1670756 RepID=A0ABQ7SAL1_9ACAR|nr:Stromal cell-derived factor 2-like protein 1 [Fragariocoptes setiger]
MDRLNIFHLLLTNLIFILVNSHVQHLAQAETPKHVTCGSVIKLANMDKPKVRLHSHDIKYGSGSGQQSVTAVENQDTNSYWSVMGPVTGHCTRGQAIECGAIVRLQHSQTRKFLHSHHFKSPVSAEQEVSAFGADNDSDTGDHWSVHCSGKLWLTNEGVKLKHVDTETWLSLSGNKYGRPIYGHLEVIASSYPESSSFWKTAEGVFVSPTVTMNPSASSSDLHDEL